MELPEHLEQYMEGLCGAFALALAERVGADRLFVIANVQGEPWSDGLDFETTHVVVDHPALPLVGDVKGWRTMAEAAEDFGLDAGWKDFTVEGPYTLEDFRELYDGQIEEGPIDIDEDSIEMAGEDLRADPTRYAVVETHGGLELPVRRISETFHVGTLDRSQRRAGSHEGAALSVTSQPDAWRYIAHSTGPTQRMVPADGKPALMICAHSLSAAQKSAIRDWACEEGLLELQAQFRLTRSDEEGAPQISYHATRAEAEREAGDTDDEIVEERIAVPTQPFTEANGHPHPEPLFAMDWALVALASRTPEIAGVWWNDRLLPTTMSAPRGAIPENKIREWTADELGGPERESQRRRVRPRLG